MKLNKTVLFREWTDIPSVLVPTAQSSFRRPVPILRTLHIFMDVRSNYIVFVTHRHTNFDRVSSKTVLGQSCVLNFFIKEVLISGRNVSDSLNVQLVKNLLYSVFTNE